MIGAAFENTLLRSSLKLVSSQCCVQHQSVRHFPRKPRWVPMAKSKTYIIIDKKPQPRMEFEEVENIRENNILYSRSLWTFQSQISRELELKEQREARQISEEVEVERMKALNDIENERVRKIREAAHLEELKQMEEEILEIKRLAEEKESQKNEMTEKLLEAEMERVKNMIKLEDLDAAIEKALAVEHDYCFGINKKGQYLVGRYNGSEFVEGPVPTTPVVKAQETTKEIGKSL